MSEFGLFDNLDSDTAVRFEFGRHMTHDERLAVELYAASGVASWAHVRTEKFSEYVDPRIMYVTPDLSHHVVWLKHDGIVGDDGEEQNVVTYTKHHVVCDCAAETELDPHPASSTYCDYVEQVLYQRAHELAQEHRLPEALGALTEFDEEIMDFGLTYMGQELAIRAIEGLLATDIRHPQSWVANRINGMHEVGVLSTYIGASSKQARPLLELMEQAGLIELQGAKVIIPQNQILD